MKKHCRALLTLLSAALFFWGCTPEETTVVVKSSELQKAVNGKLGVAAIEMVFEVQSDSDPSLPEKIKRIAQPFLGKGGKIIIEKTEKHRYSDEGIALNAPTDISLDNAKMIGQFIIPIGTEAALNNAPESLMCLKYNPQSKSFHLVPGPSVYDLNRALRKIDAMIEFEYTGGVGGLTGKGTTIQIVNDAALSIGVIGAKVNDTMVLSKTYPASSGTLRISYNHNLYDGLAPCFTIGTVPNLSTPVLQQKDDTFDF